MEDNKYYDDAGGILDELEALLTETIQSRILDAIMHRFPVCFADAGVGRVPSVVVNVSKTSAFEHCAEYKK